MDAATIKGVVDRLAKLGYVATRADPADRRRLIVSLTEAGTRLFVSKVETARQVTASTVAPLSEEEARQLKELLLRLT
jgi:DNA-binding MarR family transcriptional regulator